MGVGKLMTTQDYLRVAKEAAKRDDCEDPYPFVAGWLAAVCVQRDREIERLQIELRNTRESLCELGV